MHMIQGLRPIFVLAFTKAILVFAKEVGPEDKSYLEPYLNKKYALESNDDNFDEVLKLLGVNFIMRKFGSVEKPVIELKEDGGEYILTSESAFVNTETRFRLGEEFKEVTPDGRPVDSVFTQDKNKLIQVQKGEKVTKVTREFAPDQVKVVLEVDGVASTRTYKPV